MSWEQWFILVLSLPAAYLAGSAVHDTRRWAYVFGCAAQPFWFVTAYLNGQGGIMVLACVYSFTWGRGLYNHWWREPATKSDCPYKHHAADCCCRGEGGDR